MADKRSVSAVDGVKIEYEVVGTGPPVVLLHGGFAGRSTFSRQRILAERYRLIIPSSRGHDGTESTLPPAFGFDTSEVDDLCAVLKAERADRARFIGHSSGGATAFAFARRLPERVDHLVLIEPSLFALLPDQERETVASQIQAVVDRGNREGAFSALCGTFELLGGEAWRTLDEETKITRLQALASMANIVVPHWLGLLALKVTDDDVRALRPPTLLIYGTASYDFEPLIQKRLCDLRPDLHLVIAEGAGHNAHRERTEVVNPAIERFLTS